MDRQHETPSHRERHVGRLLLQAHRAFSAEAAAGLKARGHDGITQAQIALLPHLDEAGTRATTMAMRAGMTKQGMGQLIAELERMGYVYRMPDPEDRRAALVSFTESGRLLLADAIAVTREIEAGYACLLGQERLDGLRAALIDIVTSGPNEILIRT